MWATNDERGLAIRRVRRLLVAMVVAAVIGGVAFAILIGSAPSPTTVQAGEVAIVWDATPAIASTPGTNDDKVADSTAFDSDATGNDPAELTTNPARQTYDYALGDAVLDTASEPDEVDVTLTRAYDGYSVVAFAYVENKGTEPVRVQNVAVSGTAPAGIEVGLIQDNPGTTTVSEASCGTTIAAGAAALVWWGVRVNGVEPGSLTNLLVRVEATPAVQFDAALCAVLAP